MERGAAPSAVCDPVPDGHETNAARRVFPFFLCGGNSIGKSPGAELAPPPRRCVQGFNSPAPALSVDFIVRHASIPACAVRLFLITAISGRAFASFRARPVPSKGCGSLCGCSSRADGIREPITKKYFANMKAARMKNPGGFFYLSAQNLRITQFAAGFISHRVRFTGKISCAIITTQHRTSVLKTFFHLPIDFCASVIYNGVNE